MAMNHLTSTNTLTNEAIIEGFRQGDSRLLINAYKIARPRIYAYVLRNTGAAEDAKTLVWECMEAFRKRCIKDAAFELKVEFGLYMYGIARYKWIDRMKAKAAVVVKADMGDLAVDPSFDVHQENEIREMLDFVKTSMKSLKSGCQILFKLYCFENYSHDDIASKLDINTGTSRKRLLDCRKKLAVLLKQNPHFESFKNEALVNRFIGKVMRK